MVVVMILHASTPCTVYCYVSRGKTMVESLCLRYCHYCFLSYFSFPLPPVYFRRLKCKHLKYADYCFNSPEQSLRPLRFIVIFVYHCHHPNVYRWLYDGQRSGKKCKYIYRNKSNRRYVAFSSRHRHPCIIKRPIDLLSSPQTDRTKTDYTSTDDELRKYFSINNDIPCCGWLESVCIVYRSPILVKFSTLTVLPP